MGRITCEMCGTGYPDTELRCPTCGTERPITAEFDEVNEMPKREYTPVKGGRFSQANVKKRLATKGTPVPPAEVSKKRPASRKREPSSNRGLVIAVLLLLAAVLGVMAYIYVTFIVPSLEQSFDPGKDHPAPPYNQSSPSTQQTQPSGTQSEPEQVPCEGLQLTTGSITLNKAGSGWLLAVTCEPENTTDAITFLSSDTAVATVSSEGMIIAVGSGTAEITVLCGQQSAVCTVVCDIPAETTAPADTVPETTAGAVFALNRDDITFSKAGESWLLYTGQLPLSDIQWSSADESVATISRGRVKAVGEGKTTVYAEYNGIKVSCIIRCKFPADNG